MSLNIKIKNRGKETIISVYPNMIIGDAKKLLIGDIRIHLLHYGRILNNDKAFSYYRIKDGDTIRIFSDEVITEGGGGYGLCTIDVEKNNTRIIEHDRNAPPYRSIDYGLSVQAICENDCVLKNQIIYTTLGFVTNFNILSHLNDIKCPECQKTVYPKNFGFFQCKYEIEYDKWENNKKISGSIEGKTEKEFILFSEYSGIATFSKLIFDVVEYYPY